MKRTFIKFISCVMCLCLLCSCTAGGGTAVSMYDLSRAMLGADSSFKDMTYVSSSDDDAEELLSYVSDIDYSKVGAYFVSYATDGTGNADEIAVIYVKNSSDVAEAQATLEAHLQTRKSLYATYDSTQNNKLEKGIVFTDGNYAVLIVCNKPSAVKEAFYEFLSDK